MSFRPIVLTVTADPDQPSFERRGEPVSIGVTCPRGVVERSVRWALTDQRGRHVPVQTTVLDRWGDGSVRWTLAEFQADVDAGQPSFYALSLDDLTEIAGPSLRPGLDAAVRLHFCAGLGTVKVELTITNPRAAKHPGGQWDLGDAGSVLIRDLSIKVMPVPRGDADVWGALDEIGRASCRERGW